MTPEPTIGTDGFREELVTFLAQFDQERDQGVVENALDRFIAEAVDAGRRYEVLEAVIAWLDEPDGEWFNTALRIALEIDATEILPRLHAIQQDPGLAENPMFNMRYVNVAVERLTAIAS
ncbi:MAG: hypothetical protein H6619_03415 [Deltaproteobacteria bacterium]|nr:hypothetical protein [Deltaproteobacteria bacterium]